MAGAGYKSWVDGDILTAADVNTYLMQQAVMVFADASARTSAIAAPSEGMVTYLTGTDVIEYYDGAAWQPILDQDVIEAKGDLIVGTADDAVSRLAVGTDGYVLVADSGETTGLKWAATPGAGKVLQVVSTTKTDSFTTTSSSFVDVTGVSVTITPTSATSKVFITLTGVAGGDLSRFNLLRDSTNIAQSTGSSSTDQTWLFWLNDNQPSDSFAITFLDTPATTSAITYKLQALSVNSTTLGVGRYGANDARRSITTITAFEIGA